MDRCVRISYPPAKRLPELTPRNRIQPRLREDSSGVLAGLQGRLPRSICCGETRLANASAGDVALPGKAGALDVPIFAAVAPAEPDGVPGLSIRPADDHELAKPLSRHPNWFPACHTTSDDVTTPSRNIEWRVCDHLEK